MVSQTELAEHELIACCKRAENTTQEDLEKGRAVGPMLVARTRAQFSYLQGVQGSCPQETALSFNVGLVGTTVAAHLPLADAVSDQHPIDKFQKTLETAWDLKEATNRLW